ncbi:hypothetical protein I0292_22015 [Priestia megaterium]|uniref:hypothetical protein n=1 Tax=Priestia megaterium TaxID=1404 RepID=UPI0020589AFE|nr:hypothetical protein [Priestia megaterium]UOO40438.1 hypothetical protein I0292_22015 [Priestia megaterium]
MNWIIPLVDVIFIYYLFRYISRKKFNTRVLLTFTFFFLFLIIRQDVTTIMKIVFLALTILYLHYLSKNKLFGTLYALAFFNIVIGIIQFVFVYINPAVSHAIGPTNISTLIWGQYATPTYTNFFTIFAYPRISGWSREAGFFASFVLVTYIIFLYDTNKNYSKTKNLFYHVFFIIGFLISLSKISLIAIPILLVIKFRKFFNEVPLFFGSFMFISSITFISNIFLQNKFMEDESIAHRLSGYTIMSKIDMNELFLGVPSLKDLSVFYQYPYLQSLYYADFKQFAGLPNTIVHQGLIFFIICMVLIKFLRFGFSDFLLVTLICATTDYFTSTSFVVLGFFFVLCSKQIKQKEEVVNYSENKKYTFPMVNVKNMPKSS